MDAGVRNIEELKQFGRNLNQASNALISLFQKLNNQMHQACDNWGDNKAQQFMQQFDNSNKQIESISQDMLEFSNYIERISQILEQYQNAR